MSERSEDEKFFLSLMDSHRRMMLKVCWAYTRTSHDREDLFQEMVSRLWSAFGGYDRGRPFSTWMYRVALNVAIDYGRRQTRRQLEAASPDALDQATSHRDSPRQELVEELHELLERQSEADRAILLLCLEGNSHREIGEITHKKGDIVLFLSSKISPFADRVLVICQSLVYSCYCSQNLNCQSKTSPLAPSQGWAFGVTSHWTEWQAALAQIRVIDYRSPDNFVIAIGNLSGEDLLLAKIPQPATLQSGITDVSTRIRDSRLPPDARSVVVEEQVVIPVLEVSVKADFEGELNHADQPPGSRAVSATQIIQFRLDERGAVVWSEAGVVGENGGYDYAPGTRTFIFDKPFLVMLRESPEKNPYFAAWIGNADLMIPHGQD